MQFINLKAQYKRIEDDVKNRIHAVLEHGCYIGGPEIAELEQMLCGYTGAKHCIGLGSGTDALLLALLALDIKAGDEVITTPFTFMATAETIALLGAKPVLVDIDPKTYNIDAKLIDNAITDKTKAIIPVGLYGQCSDMDAINAIANKHQLAVIEDAAQSFGAVYKGRKSCNLSTIATTSFFPAKPLGAYGEAGACFTNDDALALKIQQLRNHGMDRRYHQILLGYNARLDSMQAAVLLAKMAIFPDEVQARQDVAKRYDALLSDVVTTPYIEKDYTSVYAQYTIRVDNRDDVIEALKEQGIPSAVHYPIPLHLQPVFEYLGYGKGDFPHAETAAHEVLSLPMDAYLAHDDQSKIANALRNIFAMAA